MGDHKDKRKEIYTYEAPWPIYGMNWSSRMDKPYRLAMGSFLEDYTNRVDVIQLNEETEVFEVKGSFEHPYPTTKIMWIPDKTAARPDLLGTTGDYMRLWEVVDGKKIELKCLLNNVCTPCADVRNTASHATHARHHADVYTCARQHTNYPKCKPTFQDTIHTQDSTRATHKRTLCIHNTQLSTRNHKNIITIRDEAWQYKTPSA